MEEKQTVHARGPSEEEGNSRLMRLRGGGKEAGKEDTGGKESSLTASERAVYRRPRNDVHSDDVGK